MLYIEQLSSVCSKADDCFKTSRLCPCLLYTLPGTADVEIKVSLVNSGSE